MENSPIRIVTVIGTTYGVNNGVATSRPSTAPSTEIAGVIMPSPYSSAVPKMPSAISTGRPTARRDPLLVLSSPSVGINAVSARMPPSPWLSARNTSATYFTETTSRSA